MIVRNEESMLPGCLESAAPVVDEINIVDTGSTDDTRAIAKDFGARLKEIEWIDFSDARNQSLAMASGEWALVLDADESLIYDDPDGLRRAVADRHAADLYSMQIFNVHEMTEYVDLKKTTISYHERFFRREGARFINPVHERVMLSPGARFATLGGTRIIHYGYLDAIVAQQDKKGRNAPLIQAWQEAEPENAEANFYLAFEMYKARSFKEAARYYEKAIPGLMAEELSNRAHAYVSLSQCYFQAGLVSKGREILAEGIEKMPDSVEIRFVMGSLLLETSQLDLAIEQFRECLKIGEGGTKYQLSIRGAGSWRAMGQLVPAFTQKGEEEKAFMAQCISNFMQEKPMPPNRGSALGPKGEKLVDALVERGALDEGCSSIFDHIKPD